MSDLYWLNDEQMAKLEPFFPKSHGKPRVDDRRVLSGVIFVNRNGLRWRDAPEAYRKRHKIENSFARLKDWRRVATVTKRPLWAVLAYKAEFDVVILEVAISASLQND